MTQPQAPPLIDLNVLATMRRVRRGLDPREVAAVLNVAIREIERMWRERDAAIKENDTLKAALRQWQTEQYEGAGHRPQPRPLRDNEDPR